MVDHDGYRRPNYSKCTRCNEVNVNQNAKKYETILVDIGDDHVATVQINRPSVMNSFNRTMMDEFRCFWEFAAHEASIHAIVLRAAPGRAFSTGFDVKAGGNVTRSAHDNPWHAVDPGESLGPKSNRCWKPVIAAVHGLAAGGAFYWLGEADIIICSEDAAFFDPHVTYGMTAAVEPICMTYRMPLGDVLRMALLGNDERIGAQTALRIGLVTEITSLEELWPRAHALAATIAAKPTIATQGTVRAIWESLDLTRTPALRHALSYTQIGNSPGIAQVDRKTIMSQTKTFTVR